VESQTLPLYLQVASANPLRVHPAKRRRCRVHNKLLAASVASLRHAPRVRDAFSNSADLTYLSRARKPGGVGDE
jgi:hypothetical protein